jgi:hypothetical protein
MPFVAAGAWGEHYNFIITSVLSSSLVELENRFLVRERHDDGEGETRDAGCRNWSWTYYKGRREDLGEKRLHEIALLLGARRNRYLRK